MHCTIDADLKAPELVACQERHFGQITAGIQLMPYEVRMDRAEFIATCEPLYLEYVGYERKDEPFYRPGTDAGTRRFRDGAAEDRNAAKAGRQEHRLGGA